MAVTVRLWPPDPDSSPFFEGENEYIYFQAVVSAPSSMGNIVWDIPGGTPPTGWNVDLTFLNEYYDFDMLGSPLPASAIGTWTWTMRATDSVSLESGTYVYVATVSSALPPGTISDLSIVSDYYNGVPYNKPNWSGPSPSATSYNVYRGTVSGTLISLDTTTDTWYDDYAVLPIGQIWYYQVEGVNVAGTGPLSNEGTATTPDRPTGGPYFYPIDWHGENVDIERAKKGAPYAHGPYYHDFGGTYGEKVYFVFNGTAAAGNGGIYAGWSLDGITFQFSTNTRIPTTDMPSNSIGYWDCCEYGEGTNHKLYVTFRSTNTIKYDTFIHNVATGFIEGTFAQLDAYWDLWEYDFTNDTWAAVSTGIDGPRSWIGYWNYGNAVTPADALAYGEFGGYEYEGGTGVSTYNAWARPTNDAYRNFFLRYRPSDNTLVFYGYDTSDYDLSASQISPYYDFRRYIRLATSTFDLSTQTWGVRTAFPTEDSSIAGVWWIDAETSGSWDYAVYGQVRVISGNGWTSDPATDTAWLLNNIYDVVVYNGANHYHVPNYVINSPGAGTYDDLPLVLNRSDLSAPHDIFPYAISPPFGNVSKPTRRSDSIYLSITNQDRDVEIWKVTDSTATVITTLAINAQFSRGFSGGNASQIYEGYNHNVFWMDGYAYLGWAENLGNEWAYTVDGTTTLSLIHI